MKINSVNLPYRLDLFLLWVINQTFFPQEPLATNIHRKSCEVIFLSQPLAMKCCQKEFGIWRVLLLLLRCERGPLKRTYVSHFFIPLFSSFAVIPTEKAISSTRQTSASPTFSSVYYATIFVVFPCAIKQLQLLSEVEKYIFL